MPNPNETMAGLLASGKAIMSGEWRGYKPETINYTNSKTGKPASFGRIVHMVEVGEGAKIEQVNVSESVPDGVDPNKVAVAHKKGSRVIIEVDSMEVAKGQRTVRTTAVHAG
jgi:hypothetical protein